MVADGRPEGYFFPIGFLFVICIEPPGAGQDRPGLFQVNLLMPEIPDTPSDAEGLLTWPQLT